MSIKCILPALLALSPDGFSWTKATPLPADRVSYTPGWTVGPFFHLMVHGSRDCWVTRQSKDGQLAPWILVRDQGFSDTKWSNPVVSVGPRVYAFGHWGRARTAILGPSGVLGKWQNAMEEEGMGGGKEPILWGGGACAEIGPTRVLYHVGGFEYEGENFTNPRSQNKVFFARIRPDGPLTNWKRTTPLPYHPMGASVVYHEGRLYVFGGRGGRFGVGDSVDGMIDDVYAARANADGTLGNWSKLSRKLPWKACGIAAFVKGGYLYVIGGELEGDGAGTATAFTDQCARSRIGPADLGPWEKLPSLPGRAGKTPHGFIGDWFYLVGLSAEGKTPIYAAKVPNR